jgi:TonB family protein
MNPQIRQRAAAVLLLMAALSLTPISASAQDSAKRKIASRIAPTYPALARDMALEGSVKLEVVVEADGSVKSVDIKGGHPVLAQAAANTVRRWRWEPAAHESREVVEIKFSPQE